MDASFAGIWFAAGLGAFWALVLGAVLALCRAAQGPRPRHASRNGLGR